MDIIFRKDAKSAGLKRYFTGKPCVQGHVSERHKCSGSCVVCALSGAQAWKDRNRDHVNQYAKEYEAAIPLELRREKDRRRAIRHPGRTSKQARAWMEAHPEYSIERAELSAAWKRENKDRINECARIIYWQDPAKAASKAHTRRLRMADGGSFTKEDIADIRKMQRDKCGVCRMKLERKGQIDHVTSLAKGGKNNRQNLQLLCGPCNASKSAKDPIEFMQSLGRLL